MKGEIDMDINWSSVLTIALGFGIANLATWLIPWLVVAAMGGGGTPEVKVLNHYGGSLDLHCSNCCPVLRREQGR